MKVLAPAVLMLEAIAVALAIPVAVATSARGAAVGWWLAVLALALVVAAGLARRPVGVAVGWALQVAVLASGLLLPAMFALGLIFLVVWITAVVYGGKADRVEAAYLAANPPAGPPAAAADGEPPQSR